MSRLVFTGGHYPGMWDRFRHYGPSASRFDHHLPPIGGDAREQERGIMYLATGDVAFNTCIAECFQETRRICPRERTPAMVVFALARDICLLDLRGTFSTRVGASMAIHAGPRSVARLWSRLLYASYPAIDGLLYRSSMNGGANAIALYERAQGAIPDTCLLHRLLCDPLLAPALAGAADTLGYLIVDD
ncbi:MAG: RES family NAD+ phosphorylase [Parahaliea sp.]